MTDERADLMLDILRGLQRDMAALRRDMVAFTARLTTMEVNVRGLVKTLVDRAEKRVGSMQTEH